MSSVLGCEKEVLLQGKGAGVRNAEPGRRHGNEAIGKGDRSDLQGIPNRSRLSS